MVCWIDAVTVLRVTLSLMGHDRALLGCELPRFAHHIRATMRERRHDDRYEIHSAAPSRHASMLFSQGIDSRRVASSTACPRRGDEARRRHSAPCGRRGARAMNMTAI